jgi:hypothetical protein
MAMATPSDPDALVVYQENPELYAHIKDFLPSMPDPRPKETLSKMKQEVFNPWKRLGKKR